jgi:spore coat protein CotH
MRTRRTASRCLVLTMAFFAASPSSTAAVPTQDNFFSDATLQEIRLVLSSRDWQALKERFGENTYYPADLTWNDMTVRNVGIRSRGSATRNGVKPGLRVDINRYVTNQEFLGLKAFILDNMFGDTSLVRESVTMKMFAKMQLPAPREAYARVYVNNEYAGAYVLIESIDRTFIERVFGRQEGNVESGGYLLEYQYHYPYYFEYPGPGLEAYVQLFRPQTRETDSVVNIYGPLEDMIRTINESSDGEFAAAAGKFLDVDLVMKYLAVESFMVEWDGLTGFAGANNFYLYRMRQGGKSLFLPKDKDASLAFVDAPATHRFDENVLVRRLIMVPDLRQAYLEALKQCILLAGEPGPDDPRGWLEREVERQTSVVRPAIAEDPVYPYSFEDFSAAVDLLTEFAQRRASFVSCDVAQMEGLNSACSFGLNP